MKLFNQSIKFPVNLVSSDDQVMTQSSANEQLIDSTQKINNQSQEPVSVPLSSLSFLPARPILVVCLPTLSLIHLQTSPCGPRSPDHWGGGHKAVSLLTVCLLSPGSLKTDGDCRDQGISSLSLHSRCTPDPHSSFWECHVPLVTRYPPRPEPRDIALRSLSRSVCVCRTF